jgi:hypothetical protein
MPPPYSWTAVYADGSMLHQFDELGNQTSSDSIDRNQLKTVIFHGLLGPLVVMHIQPGETFFYRRRAEHHCSTSMSHESQDALKVGHILGTWTRGLDTIGNEMDIQRTIFVSQPDYGPPVVEAFGSPMRGTQWHYEVVPVEAEIKHLTQ